MDSKNFNVINDILYLFLLMSHNYFSQSYHLSFFIIKLLPYLI